MGLIRLIGLVAILQAGAGHALAQAALFEEILLQTAKLLVNQVIGLVDEAERDVSHDFGRASFHKLAVVLISLRRLAAQLTDVLRLLGVLGRMRGMGIMRKMFLITPILPILPIL